MSIFCANICKNKQQHTKKKSELGLGPLTSEFLFRILGFFNSTIIYISDQIILSMKFFIDYGSFFIFWTSYKNLSLCNRRHY